jgi:recombination protein RecR
MLPESIAKLEKLFARLPGVGEKTAARYVLHLLTSDPEIARAIGEELAHLHERVRPCVRCGNLAEVISPHDAANDVANHAANDAGPVCDICTDGKRDGHVLCVVGRVHDLFAIERTGMMRGRYFVLGRLLSPLEGTGPEDLPLMRLRARIKDEGVREVILATPPSVDGEATALFLRRELADMSVSVTRIASGVPHGGDLEYTDPITMSRALAGRQKV